MLEETLTALAIKDNGVYVDATFGGGGHSRAILKNNKNIKLFAFDKDEEAEQNALKMTNEMKLNKNNFEFFKADYRYLKNFIDYKHKHKVNGILADLGVSSHQLDKDERGFSYRKNAKIDMRMSQSATKKASNVINEYSEEKLALIFKTYGELKKANFMAKLIVEAREKKNIETVYDLNQAVAKALPKYNEYKILAKLYQAIRIEVNDEMTGLARLLEAAKKILQPNGRLVILTYHSLEDRIVKNFINSGNINGKIETDIYGNPNCPFEWIKPKYVVPSKKEIENNSRAASAKLRTAKHK